ncbi:hypothetical protein CVIRNUC_006695 [Coccomyxa viridis]|uniref:RRM domain-containing protein n=1 Tax=Coccomyxa viridis TaxID=1274662 RepID=A0AAV1I822_9CHLO|nr:hypothetical protein CVIRNUC_006695 [Coccomyxa viridis]
MQGYEAAAAAAAPRFSPADPHSSQGKALYVGNLHSSVSQEMLQEIFSTLGPVGEIKIIKDKLTGLSAGYGFVQYLDPRAAEMALQSLNGRVLHGQELRVNWAFQKDQREDSSSQFQIFVGDLASDVNDKMLLDAFFPFGCTDARVMWDHNTGRTKGYGFVAFKARADAEKALAQMSGAMLGSRRIRCGWAQHKQETSSASYVAVDRADPENANVYIGNLAAEVTDLELRQHVGQFGIVLDVKIYRKGGYAFAQYATHAEAVRAIVGLSGQNLGGKALKCSWGRHQARKTGPDALPAGIGGGFDYLTLQQQQQISLQQQLAMQQLGYPQGYAQSLAPLGITPGAPFQGQLSPQQQQQLAAQQLMGSGGSQYLAPPGQQQLDFNSLYGYPGGMYYQ